MKVRLLNVAEGIFYSIMVGLLLVTAVRAMDPFDWPYLSEEVVKNMLAERSKELSPLFLLHDMSNLSLPDPLSPLLVAPSPEQSAASAPVVKKRRAKGQLRTNKRRKNNGTCLTPEELKEKIITLCGNKCFCCVRKEAKNWAGKCNQCDDHCYSGDYEKQAHSLFMHIVEDHHKVGPHIYQYEGKNYCDGDKYRLCGIDGCREQLKSRRGLSFHIIARHLCTLQKQAHKFHP